VNYQLRVGLAGAGPWAGNVHAPGIADHPGTELTTLWARREDRARDLAEPYGAGVSANFDELLDQVDAVAFAVPPAVQAELAVRAAEAGKHVILEKPIAHDLAGAERLAAAVSEAGVASLVVLILRYAMETRDWLAGIAEAGGWAGGSARWISGALLDGPYQGSRWRQEQGALHDIGPHALDLLDAALGRITRVLGAHRTDDDLWQLVLAHDGGAVSTATLTMRLPVQPSVVEVAVYGEHGFRTLARKSGAANAAYTALLDDFAAMVASGVTGHPCDVHRGLHLQRLLHEAREQATRP
jgi:predicted dehydrogenase